MGFTGGVTGGVGSGLGFSGPGVCGTVSTVNARVALVWLPALSVARTRKTYAPSASGATAAYVVALAHGPYAGVPWSIEHSTVAPASAEKPNSGVLSLVVPDGPKPIDSDGGTVSTVNVRESIALFPTPSGRPHAEDVRPVGERRRRVRASRVVHGPYAGVPWSTEHSTVVPGSAVNPNDGVRVVRRPRRTGVDRQRRRRAVDREDLRGSPGSPPRRSPARGRCMLPSGSAAAGVSGLVQGAYAGVP